MMASRERKKKEALKRMEKLGIFYLVRDDFRDNDSPQISEPPLGACYWFDKEQQERAKKIEEETGGLIYHAILSPTNFGLMESYLMVSDYPEEWEDDWEMIEEGIVFAYVYNKDMPDCSEMGDIQVGLTPAGGLKRLY